MSNAITLNTKIAILFSLTCLTGYSESSESIVMSADVEIEVSISETSEQQIIIAGDTNLPSGTIILVSLRNEVLGFEFTDKLSVDQGRFITSPMGTKSRLVDGKYLVEVTMPLPFVQPEEVQKIVGLYGEHLTGTHAYQTDFGGKIVKFSKYHSIGSEEAILQSADAHNRLVKTIAEETTRLVNEGKQMNSLRLSNDIALNQECGQKMREHQHSATILRSKAESLSDKYIYLGSAVIELNTCVSCSRTAMESCDRADEYIYEQNKSNSQ